MNPSRKAEPDKSEKADATAKAGEKIVLSDPIGFVVERIVALGPEVKVRVHDEQWADITFEAESIEQIIRGLREISEATRETLSDKPRQVHRGSRKGSEENFVEKLPHHARVAASFCLAGDGKLYVDAIPMPLKAYLSTFVDELCGVRAVKATMTTGICAEMRSSQDYLPNT